MFIHKPTYPNQKEKPNTLILAFGIGFWPHKIILNFQNVDFFSSFFN